MRTLPGWLLLLALAALPAAAAGAADEAQGPQPAPPRGATLRFVPLEAGTASSAGGDAYVDVGRLSAPGTAARGRAIVVRRRVAVRLDDPSAATTARLSVSLTAETPGCTVRVDGIALSTLPRTIDPVHRLGTAVAHEIEITIPESVPPGTFVSDLQWFAESD